MSEADYSRKYDEFIAVYARRREWVGRLVLGKATGEELPALQQAVVDTRPIEDRLARDLNPYRSWFMRSTNIAELLDSLAIRQIIALADIPESELAPVAPGGAMRSRGDRLRLLPDASIIRVSPEPCIHPSCQQYGRCEHQLEELVGTAWRFFRGDTPMPQARVEASVDDPVHLLPALYRSMQLGVPLKPMPASHNPASLSSCATDCSIPHGGFTEEAVVVEVENDASLLLSVQYAYLYGAHLVCFPKPDHREIDDVLASIEVRQQDASKSMQYVSTHRARGSEIAQLNPIERAILTSLKSYDPITDEQHPYEPKAFLDHLRHWLAVRSNSGLSDIEKCVSKVVPEGVVDAVGDAALTAVTDGVPYQFVRHGSVDWSHKPIGHITGDVQLLLYREVYGTGTPAVDAAFDLLFDPGYFPEETLEILRTLKGRVSYPLKLAGEDSNQDALLGLCRLLPTELVFLNTHGFSAGIVLSEGPMEGYRIGQRMLLTQRMRTVVFNNSCVSWQGMGREFIRSGAGTYIGTLWSIDADYARILSQRVVERMIRDHLPVAVCFAEERDCSPTSLAYIVVGSVRSVLSSTGAGTANTANRIVRTACYLLNAANDFAKRHDFIANQWEQSLANLLLAEADRCSEQARIAPQQPDRDEIIEMLLLRAEFFERYGIVEHLVKVPELLSQSEQLLDEAETEQGGQVLGTATALSDACSYRVLLLRIKGRYYSRLGESAQAEAEAVYVKLADMMSDRGGATSSVYCEMSDFYKKIARYEDALAYALKARFAAEQEQDPVKRLHDLTLSLGRVVQARSRLGDLDTALAEAQLGCDLATQLDDEAEQFEFNCDIARIFFKKKQWDDADKAIGLCETLAVRAHNVVQDLNAAGMRAMLEIERKNWYQAKAAVLWGLERSKLLGFLGIKGDFHVDAALICSGNADLSNALLHLYEAIRLFQDSGDLAKVNATLVLANKVYGSIYASQSSEH